MDKLKALFEPAKIGNIKMKNRIVCLGLSTGYEEEGFVTPRQKVFFEERAKGGAGLIILGAVSPIRRLPGPGFLSIAHDRYVPGLRELVEAIHDYDSKIFCQILFSYHFAKDEEAPIEIVGPSDHLHRLLNTQARGLTKEEIHLLVEDGGDAAKRAREAGFDGVEIQMGMGYLLCRFVSTHTNKRTDEYGGPPENRLRIVLELIENVKRKAGGGPDFPIICRISPEEFMEGGLTVEDWKVLAPMLERAGVLGLDVEAGWHECPVPLTQMNVPRGAFVYLAHEMKKVVNIPVIASHRINDPIMANQIIQEGKADMAGMARPLIADPYLPLKAKEENFEEIRYCLACNRCLDEHMWGGILPLSCAVNPQGGYEAEYTVEPTLQPKKIIVVGGGPAGMEAARVAAQRGHKVILFEKEKELGGQLIPASMPPGKAEIDTLRKHLSHLVRKEGVDVRLSCEATAEMIEVEKPHVLIWATGAVPATPDIPGAKGPNVLNPIEVLKGLKETSDKVVVVGGGRIGCEVAHFLADRGKKVTLLSRRRRIGDDIGRTTRWVIIGNMRKAGIQMEPETSTQEITARGVTARTNQGMRFFEADTVVLAGGMEAEKMLTAEPKGKSYPAYTVYTIGDCAQPRNIKEAISEGFRVGREA